MSDSLRLAGSSWILHARVLEWVAMPFSRGSSWPRDQTHVSCLLHWQVGSLPLAPPGEGTWPAPTSSQIYFLVSKFISFHPSSAKSLNLFKHQLKNLKSKVSSKYHLISYGWNSKYYSFWDKFPSNYESVKAMCFQNTILECCCCCC